jgi:phenylalanyl-tRNA synthetase beta chain
MWSTSPISLCWKNQPLHAFDYDLLSQAKRILVRRAEAEEKIVTLDDVERMLDKEMLLITDDGRPVALAGIMGGQNTEISDDTVNVLLESACFYGVGIRKTSRKLALRSDSSMRFEKGADVNGLIYALNGRRTLFSNWRRGKWYRAFATAIRLPRPCGRSDCVPADQRFAGHQPDHGGNQRLYP